MSPGLQNFRVFCRYSLVNLIQKSYCHTLKKETLPRSIFKQLSEEPAEIFTYVEKNHELLSAQHCIEALQKLKKSCIKFGDNNDNGLAQLCNELKKRITTLDVSEAVVALSALTNLQVPTNTIIYESLLQIIRSNINSLTIEDAISLEKDLRNAKRTSLVEAISLALPTIFEIQLPKIDSRNINLLAVCLVYATKLERRNMGSIHFILDAISNYEGTIPLKAAKFIFKSLAFVPNVRRNYPNVISTVLNILIEEAPSISFNDAMAILRTMANARNTNALYNEYLVDSLIDSVIIEDDLGFENGCEALGLLVKIGHEQIPLLDYVATKFIEESDFLENAHLVDVFPFLSAMSMCDYKPVFWDRIQELILGNKFLDIDKRLIDFVVHLAVLDCYSTRLLKKVFQQNTQIDLMNESNKRHILRLYQIIKTLHVGYEDSFPFESQLHLLFDWEQYNSRSFPLWKALEFAVGGAQFVETKVGTKNGHFIDHVILCNKETGSPVAITYKDGQKIEFSTAKDFSNRPITFLENIFVPEDCQVVSFVNIPPEGYTINTSQLKGHWNSYIKTLEAMNSLVIPICPEKWQQLLDKEKIPYLMHAIRLKCTINQNPL